MSLSLYKHLCPDGPQPAATNNNNTNSSIYVEMLTQNSAVKATNQLNSTLKILPNSKRRSRLSMFPDCDAVVDQAQTDGVATTLASI